MGIDADVFSVIVTYHPNTDAVQRSVDVLTDCEVGVVIVDNSESDSLIQLCGNVKVIALGENVGIAAAQNIGVKHAIDCGAKRIIFFDQDSSFDKCLVQGLIHNLSKDVPKIVAPVFFDENKGFEYPSIRVSPWGFRKKIYAAHFVKPCKVDIVISSGSATNIAAIEKLGKFNEDFFIDYVDTEWCLRARDVNVPIYVLPNLRMMHSIGDNSLRIWKWRVPIHNAVRRYYRVRNSFLLLRLPHVPKVLALREIFFSIIHQVIILLKYTRRSYLYIFFKALKDGVLGRTGKMR